MTRYILVATEVFTSGEGPNRLGLFVLGRDGWLAWPSVEGQTNCTNPDLCPILSYEYEEEALVKGYEVGGTVVPVHTDSPSEGPVYSTGPYGGNVERVPRSWYGEVMRPE